MTATQTASHDVQVGDIFVSSWGYGQTNIDYYEVVGVTRTGARFLRIRKERTGGNGYSDTVVPLAGQYVRTRDGGLPKPFFRKVSDGWINLTSFSGAGRWDGEPDHETDPRHGH